MAEAIIKSESDRLYAISDLRRKARRTALEAARAAPSLSVELQSLAALLEAQATQLEKHVVALIEDFGDCRSPA
jgi:hypothetical protein